MERFNEIEKLKDRSKTVLRMAFAESVFLPFHGICVCVVVFMKSRSPGRGKFALELGRMVNSVCLAGKRR